MNIDSKTAAGIVSQIEVSPFIDGAFIHSNSEAELQLFSPATGQPTITIPQGCATDAEKAVASAHQVFEQGDWSDQSPLYRQTVLLKFAYLIDREAETLDTLDALDMGKPIGLGIGANTAAYLMRFSANAINTIFGDVYPSDRASFITQRRVPLGVVAAITPWNFPTTNAVIKIAPALAAGNCVVLKPSECSPRSAMLLAQLAIEAGLPAGVFNIVPGLGETVGKALALSMDVDMLTFTGSTTVGKLMLEYAGQSNMKLVHAECGGKSPNIVFNDFTDLDTVADDVAQEIIFNQGQLCVAGTRLLVQQDIEPLLIEKIAERLNQVKAGDPLNTETSFGPLVNQRQMKRVLGFIAEGIDSGATLVCGGQQIMEQSGGCYIAPTLFCHVPPQASIAQEEIFGPVLSATTFTTQEEAIQLANSTRYGLFAHLWTKDLSLGMAVSKRIRSNVAIHSAAPSGDGPGCPVTMEPFGQSGVGVESGVAGLETYLRRQVMWFDHE